MNHLYAGCKMANFIAFQGRATEKASRGEAGWEGGGQGEGDFTLRRRK